MKAQTTLQYLLNRDPTSLIREKLPKENFPFGKHWFRAAFQATYPFDDADLANPLHRKYADHSITRISSFFGLPNVMPKDGKPTWANVAKQFFGLPDRELVLSDFVYAPTALIIGSLNLAKALLTTAWNALVKAPLELPLTALRNFCAYKCAKAETKAGKWFAFGAYIFANALLFPIRAATSPVNNARDAKKFGNDLYPGTTKGKVLGYVFMAGSILTTAALIVVSPYILKGLMVTVLPKIAAHAPVWIAKAATGLLKGLHGLGALLSQAPHWVTTVGQTLKPALTFIGVNVAPSILGSITLIGAAIGVGSLLSAIKTKFVASNRQESIPMKEIHHEVKETKEDPIDVSDNLKSKRNHIAAVVPAPVDIHTQTTANIQLALNDEDAKPEKQEEVISRAPVPRPKNFVTIDDRPNTGIKGDNWRAKMRVRFPKPRIPKNYEFGTPSPGDFFYPAKPERVEGRIEIYPKGKQIADLKIRHRAHVSYSGKNKDVHTEIKLTNGTLLRFKQTPQGFELLEIEDAYKKRIIPTRDEKDRMQKKLQKFLMSDITKQTDNQVRDLNRFSTATKQSRNKM